MVTSCPECQGKIINDADNGEEVCQSCGLVVNSIQLSTKPDFNFFNKEQTIHIGQAETTLLHDKGLSTVISPYNQDSCHSKLSPSKQAEFHRLRKWQTRSRVCRHNEMSLLNGLDLINLYSEKLSLLHSVSNRASIIYRKLQQKGYVKGRTISALASASLYYACRELQVLRDLTEVAKATSVPKKALFSTYTFILSKLPEVTLTSTPKSYSFTKYITRIQKQGEAIKLLTTIKQNGRTLDGKSPKSLACASLYIVCSDPETIAYLGLKPCEVTQKVIADSAGITEVTVRNRYKQLKEEVLKKTVTLLRT